MAIVIAWRVCVRIFGDLLLIVYDQYLFLVHVRFVRLPWVCRSYVSPLPVRAAGACGPPAEESNLSFDGKCSKYSL